MAHVLDLLLHVLGALSVLSFVLAVLVDPENIPW